MTKCLNIFDMLYASADVRWYKVKFSFLDRRYLLYKLQKKLFLIKIIAFIILKMKEIKWMIWFLKENLF